MACCLVIMYFMCSVTVSVSLHHGGLHRLPNGEVHDRHIPDPYSIHHSQDGRPVPEHHLPNTEFTHEYQRDGHQQHNMLPNSETYNQLNEDGGTMAQENFDWKQFLEYMGQDVELSPHVSTDEQSSQKDDFQTYISENKEEIGGRDNDIKDSDSGIVVESPSDEMHGIELEGRTEDEEPDVRNFGDNSEWRVYEKEHIVRGKPGSTVLPYVDIGTSSYLVEEMGMESSDSGVDTADGLNKYNEHPEAKESYGEGITTGTSRSGRLMVKDDSLLTGIPFTGEVSTVDFFESGSQSTPDSSRVMVKYTSQYHKALLQGGHTLGDKDEIDQLDQTTNGHPRSEGFDRTTHKLVFDVSTSANAKLKGKPGIDKTKEHFNIPAFSLQNKNEHLMRTATSTMESTDQSNIPTVLFNPDQGVHQSMPSENKTKSETPREDNKTPEETLASSNMGQKMKDFLHTSQQPWVGSGEQEVGSVVQIRQPNGSYVTHFHSYSGSTSHKNMDPILILSIVIGVSVFFIIITSIGLLILFRFRCRWPIEEPTLITYVPHLDDSLETSFISPVAAQIAGKNHDGQRKSQPELNGGDEAKSSSQFRSRLAGTTTAHGSEDVDVRSTGNTQDGNDTGETTVFKSSHCNGTVTVSIDVHANVMNTNGMDDVNNDSHVAHPIETECEDSKLKPLFIEIPRPCVERPADLIIRSPAMQQLDVNPSVVEIMRDFHTSDNNDSSHSTKQDDAIICVSYDDAINNGPPHSAHLCQVHELDTDGLNEVGSELDRQLLILSQRYDRSSKNGDDFADCNASFDLNECFNPLYLSNQNIDGSGCTFILPHPSLFLSTSNTGDHTYEESPDAYHGDISHDTIVLEFPKGVESSSMYTQSCPNSPLTTPNRDDSHCSIADLNIRRKNRINCSIEYGSIWKSESNIAECEFGGRLLGYCNDDLAPFFQSQGEEDWELRTTF